jgi:ABC-type histidine transport system ATPase subunit
LKVAIAARAFAMERIAMAFDEPTSAFDPEMNNEVLDVMAKLGADFPHGRCHIRDAPITEVAIPPVRPVVG